MEQILHDKNNIVICVTLIIIITTTIFFLRRGCTNVNRGFEIKNSEILNDERGLFATKSYKKGEIIEECPTIKIKNTEIEIHSNLNDYVFASYNDENMVLFPLGYCGTLNHSDEKQNATWKISPDDKNIIVHAIRNINEGEEIYVNYGNGYWSERSKKKV